MFSTTFLNILNKNKFKQKKRALHARQNPLGKKKIYKLRKLICCLMLLYLCIIADNFKDVNTIC